MLGSKKNLTDKLTKNCGLFCLGLLLLAGCEDASLEHISDESDDSKPPAGLEQSPQSENPVSVYSPNVIIAEKAFLETDAKQSNGRTGPRTYIHFGDETACLWNPNICNNSFVNWPGYIQSTGYREWGYAWMSNGPGTNFISYGTGSHYHILGLFRPMEEPNPKHSSMFGSDWFGFYMKRNGTGRINFNLTEITVRGTQPITLWFMKSNGYWAYWPSLGPGRWYLPGATNIQEFHVRSASGIATDNYSIDNIQVQGL